MTLNGPYFAFSPNSIALLANYVTVVKDRPIMSAKYCLPVPVFHFWPKLTHPAARSHCDSYVLVCLVSAAMSSLKIWNNRQLNTGTEVHVYRALALSIHRYASETWTLLADDIRRLDASHLRCLRQLPNITWRDHITSEVIPATTGLTLLQGIPSKRGRGITVRSFRYVARLNPDVLVHQAVRMQTDLSTGRKPDVGRQNGDTHLVDRARLGAARSGLTSECHLGTAGTPVSTVATVE